ESRTSPGKLKTTRKGCFFVFLREKFDKAIFKAKKTPFWGNNGTCVRKGLKNGPHIENNGTNVLMRYKKWPFHVRLV
ncbi:hypothetical protein, partial [Pseudoneobacillus sp. C159]